jgi:hypothetical protein
VAKAEKKPDEPHGRLMLPPIRCNFEQAVGFLDTFLATGAYDKPKCPEAVAYMNAIFGKNCWPTPGYITAAHAEATQTGEKVDRQRYFRQMVGLAALLHAVADGLFTPSEQRTFDNPELTEYADELALASQARMFNSLKVFGAGPDEPKQ